MELHKRENNYRNGSSTIAIGQRTVSTDFIYAPADEALQSGTLTILHNKGDHMYLSVLLLAEWALRSLT